MNEANDDDYGGQLNNRLSKHLGNKVKFKEHTSAYKLIIILCIFEVVHLWIEVKPYIVPIIYTFPNPLKSKVPIPKLGQLGGEGSVQHHNNIKPASVCRLDTNH